MSSSAAAWIEYRPSVTRTAPPSDPSREMPLAAISAAPADPVNPLMALSRRSDSDGYSLLWASPLRTSQASTAPSAERRSCRAANRSPAPPAVAPAAEDIERALPPRRRREMEGKRWEDSRLLMLQSPRGRLEDVSSGLLLEKREGCAWLFGTARAQTGAARAA